MNTETLARCTFVLAKSTAKHLSFLSHRFQRSRSQIVRDLLSEPVAAMAQLLQTLPSDPTSADIRQLRLDGLAAIDQASATARTTLGVDSDA